MEDSPASLLRPDETCWRTARADKLALLVDAEAYFEAAAAAMSSARRTITLIGWHFDSRTRLHPLELDSSPIGRFLNRLAREKPELQIRVLIWNMALVMSAGFQFYPYRAKASFAGTPVDFRLDATTWFGASHHQKILVVDDDLAFCGGADFSIDRWDSPRHLDDDPRRLDPDGDLHPARHEVMAVVSGPAARALAEVAAERWRDATGEVLTPAPPADPSPWIDTLPAALEGVEAGVTRTSAGSHGRRPLRESEALHLAAIADARSAIYLENQYFTSRVIGEALAVRLQEPDGPEVMVVSTQHCPSWFDRGTMDRARDVLIRRLREADRYGRFSIWCPLTQAGRGVIVHSKVTVIDDRVLRVGSTNLNNRSLGFDTECDLAVTAETAEDREAVRVLRDRLIGHFLGVTGASYSEAVHRTGTLAGAVRAVLEDRNSARLSPIEPNPHGWFGTIVARWQLGDPLSKDDSFKPWRRRRLAQEAAAEAAARTLRAVAQREVHPQGQVVGGDPHQGRVGGLDVQHAD